MTSIAPVTHENRLKQLRRARGLAQYGLATLAQTSPSTIVAIERWGYVPSPAVRQRLAAALGVEVRDIWPDTETAA
jgi:DNA-binding XRE family transcriptional regulator